MQYPPNSPGNFGPNDYTQPTYPYQQPYGQYPPPPPRRSRWYLWFSMSPEAVNYRKTRGQQWAKTPQGKAIGCGILVISLLLCCGMCSAISNAGSHANQSTADTTTPTTQALVSHAITATAKPTPKPIPTPTPEQVQPTPTPAPVIQPTPTPVPQAPTCNGTVMDGICYNTDPTGGSVVTNTPSGFCGYYRCITSFYSGTGYIVECGNQEWSHSGGKSGACSRDGGIIATLYSH